MRLLFSTLVALIAALALFVLMQRLVSAPGGSVMTPRQTERISFVRLDAGEVTRREPRKKPPPPPPQLQPPAAAAIPSSPVPRPPLPQLAMPPLPIVPVASARPYLGVYDLAQNVVEGDVVPIVRIEPQYPREAQLAGTTGWVRIEFTINEDGSVSDPQVSEAEPPRIFNRAALRAILRWKFKPRVVDGVATSRRASQVIEFQLEG